MGYKDEPSPFKDYNEAAAAIVNAFIGENLGGSYAIRWRDEYMPKFVATLQKDGVLPNWYEVDALNGSVPEDGSNPYTVEAALKDYGCPADVAAKFPATDALIASQF